ncbi:unnamed protein product [Mycena citricolor]|uniref:Uncharacterized protein n=1 Tax=Mycena citricolor TaxID=2018698 RepID=A0AAD2HKG7_9AGAR|nr:unnamed protein product [Mycena citricolor]
MILFVILVLVVIPVLWQPWLGRALGFWWQVFLLESRLLQIRAFLLPCCHLGCMILLDPGPLLLERSFCSPLILPHCLPLLPLCVLVLLLCVQCLNFVEKVIRREALCLAFEKPCPFICCTLLPQVGMRALEHLLMNSFPHLSPFELLSPKLGPANDQSGASSDLGMDSMTGSEMGLVREVILGVLSSSEPDDEAPKCAYKDRIFFDGVHRVGLPFLL